MTDPNKPDTEDDGLNGTVEDLSVWKAPVASTAIIKHPVPLYNTPRVDRTKLPANAVMLTTDPNNADTDGDGIPDGQEDLDRDGAVRLALEDRDESGNVTLRGALDDSNSLGYGKFHDYCYSFADSSVSPARNYVYKRVSKAKLAAAFPRPHPTLAGHTIDVICLETDPLRSR